MSANPVLIEVTRGNWVENIHRGAVAVCNASGTVLAHTGDVDRAIFPRSAIKSMQALAIFQSGAREKFGLTDEELALACASHYGEPEHVAVGTAMLDKVGCSVDDLECGVHAPVGSAARKALRESGNQPNALHNNCSGKHAGMLAVARALEVPTKDYVTRNHPVQKLVRQCVEEVIGEPLTEDRCGTDGCSIPTWAAPLKSFAAGFARMATGEGLSDPIAAASRALFDAATGHPFLVRGTDGLDTDLMTAFAGRLMIKIGAEGVFCGAIRDKGIGFALKIDDGNMDAAEAAVANLLLAIAAPNAREQAALEARASKRLENRRKIHVATVRGTQTLSLSI